MLESTFVPVWEGCARVVDNGNGFRKWTIREVEIDGMKWACGIYFKDGRIHLVDLQLHDDDAVKPYSAEAYQRGREIIKPRLDDWLQRHLGSPRRLFSWLRKRSDRDTYRYRWGTCASDFNDRDGWASIWFRYNKGGS